ncbi:MAG TPA: FAD-binding protein, partial [Baekduia sp.]|nr:FAD-binding protein [Baekduia sp.]
TVAREAQGTYDRVAAATNEVAGRLADRLARETHGEVLFSPGDRGRYATDASIYQEMPVGVFVPRTADDIKLALDICRDLKVPVVPRGGGTSQCGQTVGAGLVIDCSKHVRAVLDVDVQNRCAVVEPGQDVAPGEVGEVAARGPNITIGYWNKPEQTDAVLRDGWYRTGDLAHADERGHLFVVDRAKDMIITGGENVYCSEVEDVLARHEAVQEVAVFGVPDPRWGEAVFAVVLPRQPVDEDVLLEHCRKSIAGYKVPKAIELRTEPLPKSAAGKLLKRVLRDPHWQGSESRVAGS